MITGNASPGAIAEILDRLAADDAFREQFIADPNAALSPWGLQIDESQLPATRQLPSKEELSAARDDLQTKIESDLRLIPFLLK
jgi:putative modified peptide